MTREQIVLLLRRDNPGARADDLALYADCFCDYREAQANITANGNIVAHPRTGAPIENPYLRVKAQAMAGLQKLRRVKHTEALWSHGDSNPTPC